MGMVFRLMVFLLMFNLATGIVSLIFGANAAFLNPETGLTQVGVLNSTFAQAGSVPVEETSFWYRFIDVISLGMWGKMKLFANSTVFAVPTLLVNTGVIDSSLVIWLNGFITVILILGMFELITGRDLFSR